MYKTQKGFHAVQALLILVVIGIIAGTGWYVWRANNNTNKTLSEAKATSNTSVSKSVNNRNQSSVKLISTDDKKVQVSLPNSWHVISDSNNPNGAQIISINKNTHLCDKYNPSNCNAIAPCLDVQDTSSCVYEAEFQPTILNPQKDNVWGLTIEKTGMTIAQASEQLMGGLTTDNTVEKNSNKINGYDALYVKIRGGECTAECYVDVHYFLESSGYLIHFYNREQYINHSSNPISQKYSAYTNDFSKIVHSVKLNF
jgi:hypothetical protein